MAAGAAVRGYRIRNGATCLACGSPVPLDHIRTEGKAGRMGAQLMAVVAEGDRQRVYLPSDPDHEVAADVPRPDDVPDTELPEHALGFRVQGYGMTHHSDLFTNRQLTALTTLCDLVDEARRRMILADGRTLSMRTLWRRILALLISTSLQMCLQYLHLE